VQRLRVRRYFFPQKKLGRPGGGGGGRGGGGGFFFFIPFSVGQTGGRAFCAQSTAPGDREYIGSLIVNVQAPAYYELRLTVRLVVSGSSIMALKSRGVSEKTATILNPRVARPGRDKQSPVHHGHQQGYACCLTTERGRAWISGPSSSAPQLNSGQRHCRTRYQPDHGRRYFANQLIESSFSPSTKVTVSEMPTQTQQQPVTRSLATAANLRPATAGIERRRRFS